MSTTIVQDFVVGYALLPVLVDVEAVVAVLAKGLVPEVVQGAAADAPEDVQEVVIPAVQALAKEAVQEVVLVLVLLVLTVVLITAPVVAVHCAKGVAQDVQALATEGAQEVVLVLAPLVLTNAQVDAAEDVKQGVKTVVIRAARQDVREDVN